MAERRTAHALLEQDGHGLRSPSAGLRSAQAVRAPRAQAFEAELKKYMAVEQAVAAMPSVQALGPLTLETLPLRSSLRAEAASWKAQFARNLHRQAADELKARPAAARRGGCTRGTETRRPPVLAAASLPYTDCKPSGRRARRPRVRRRSRRTCGTPSRSWRARWRTWRTCATSWPCSRRCARRLWPALRAR